MDNGLLVLAEDVDLVDRETGKPNDTVAEVTPHAFSSKNVVIDYRARDVSNDPPTTLRKGLLLRKSLDGKYIDSVYSRELDPGEQFQIDELLGRIEALEKQSGNLSARTEEIEELVGKCGTCGTTPRECGRVFYLAPCSGWTPKKESEKPKTCECHGVKNCPSRGSDHREPKAIVVAGERIVCGEPATGAIRTYQSDPIEDEPDCIMFSGECWKCGRPISIKVKIGQDVPEFCYHCGKKL